MFFVLQSSIRANDDGPRSPYAIALARVAGCSQEKDERILRQIQILISLRFFRMRAFAGRWGECASFCRNENLDFARRSARTGAKHTRLDIAHNSAGDRYQRGATIVSIDEP